jgi:SagB-type dehydrogenase family enzyme
VEKEKNMRWNLRITVLIATAFLTGLASLGSAGQGSGGLKVIQLNAPDLHKGIPLMQALSRRKSDRDFSHKKLSLQQLSELLWAADGVNRENGKRTAPSAHALYPVDIYVALPEGVYLYEPLKRDLVPVVEGDFRGATGSQEFVAGAPVNLVYVGDLAKLGGPEDEAMVSAAIEAGHQAENVYLYCASEGLGAVVRGSIDGEKFGQIIRLRPHQRVLVAQTIGYPR